MLGHRVALSAALLAALQLLFKFVDVLTLTVMARLLTPADFGLVALAVSVLLIANAVTELPVANALIQRPKIDPADLDTAFTLSFLRGLLVALIICASAAPMASIYDDERLAAILYALALVPFIQGLSSPAIVHFMHRIEYGPTARTQMYGKIASVATSIAVGLLTRSYWALIASQVAGIAASVALTYYFAPYRPRVRFDGVREILSFAGWMTASRFISTINLQSDRFFIGHFLGKAQLGQYTMGSDIASMVTYAFAGPLMQTMFGGFSRLEGDKKRMQLAYLKGQQTLIIVLLPFGFGLSAIADRVVPLVLGPNWDAAIPVIYWLAPVVALQVLYLPLLSMSMAIGRPAVLVVREGVNFICRLPVTLAGAWYFGLIGAVIARSIGGLFIIFLTLTIARRFLEITVLRQITNIWRSLVAVTIMVVGVSLLKLTLVRPDETLLQLVEVALLVATGGVLYITSHLGLWLLVDRPDGAEQFLLSLVRRRGRA